MKKEICILMAIMLLAGTAGGIFANENKEIDYTTGTPWLCIDLEGVVTKDTPAERKDNYALYVNKEAILALEIPEGWHLCRPRSAEQGRYKKHVSWGSTAGT